MMQHMALIQQGDHHVDVEKGVSHQRPASSRRQSIVSLLTT
jgi:hypothetical protein